MTTPKKERGKIKERNEKLLDAKKGKFVYSELFKEKLPDYGYIRKYKNDEVITLMNNFHPSALAASDLAQFRLDDIKLQCSINFATFYGSIYTISLYV